jgi:hypothetical protein
MIHNSWPFGTISPQIISVKMFGFIAFAITVETVLPGNEMKTNLKKTKKSKVNNNNNNNNNNQSLFFIYLASFMILICFFIRLIISFSFHFFLFIS